MIVVTGAGGFVGSRLVARLRQAGHEVRPLLRPGADLTKPATLPPLLEGADAIAHCAAIVASHKEPYPGAYEAINHGGAENLARAAKAAGVGRIVALSGITKPAPPGTYMATRNAADAAIRGSGVPWTILQPSILFGEGAEFIAALAGIVRVSPVVPLIGGGGLAFQPLWIEDLLRCLETALTEERPRQAEVPLGGPERVTFKEVVQTICEVMGKRRLLLPLPLAIARQQARLMAALLPSPPLTPAALELFGFDNTTDADSVQRAFGFQPRGFREHLLAHGIDG